MKHTAVLSLLAMASSLAFGQVNPQDHAVHHPEGAASAPAAAPLAASPGAQSSTPDRFAEQTRMMQDMHQRMQAARTPAEKQALMGEHMKLMQSGMQMMSQMSQSAGSMGMGAMGSTGASPGTPGSTPNQPGAAAMGGMMTMHGTMHGAMERRMAMMEQMMQMMVDREAAVPRR